MQITHQNVARREKVELKQKKRRRRITRKKRVTAKQERMKKRKELKTQPSWPSNAAAIHTLNQHSEIKVCKSNTCKYKEVTRHDCPL